jgi:hypothetical protein
VENQPQSALVLIQSGLRLITLLCLQADNESSNVTSAIGRIIGVRLIEDNDQQTILLKCGTGDQRRDVLLQPGIGQLERPDVAMAGENLSKDNGCGATGAYPQTTVLAAAGNYGPIGAGKTPDSRFQPPSTAEGNK